MSEKLNSTTPPIQPNPEVMMDIGTGRYLDSDEIIEVNEENLREVLGHVPAIDPAKIRLRLVGFYDKEYAIGQPDEEGIVTITLPAKNAAKQLPLALREYSDMLENLPAHTAATGAMTEIGEAASDITNRQGAVVGTFAIAAMPELISMSLLSDVGSALSPRRRRARKLAKAVKNSPAFSVKRTKQD